MLRQPPRQRKACGRVYARPRSSVLFFSHAAIHVWRAGGWSFCAVLVLCCLSCGRSTGVSEEDQQPVGTDRELVTSASETDTPHSNSSPSHNDNATLKSETKDGSSTRAGSASKELQQAASHGAFKDSNVNSAAPITTSAAKEWVEEMQRDMNPSNDGWDTELFAERASAQLKHLGKLMTSGHPITTGDLSSLLSENFSSSVLRPAKLQKVFEDASISVQRSQQLADVTVHEGAEGLIRVLLELTAGLDDATDKHFKFKLFRVAPEGEEVGTTSYFEISGRTPSVAIQRSATWKSRWEPGTSDSEPRLLSVTLEDYEEVEIRNHNQKLFSDCTESIFRDIPAYDEQFRRGIDYWRARLENYLGIFYDGLRGLALGDVNGDGLDDVYLCEPGGLPNRLFVQTPEGLLKDVSAQSGVDLLDSTRIALFVDLDNDGDQDLVMPVERQIQFFSNNGKGQFTREVKLPFEGQTALTIAAADYDQDGNIDVYACFYHGLGEEESNRQPAPIPYHDSRTGGFNRLLRNEGNWKFQDITNEVGLDHNNDRWSFAAVWEDYDNDGDLDLYVANDFGRNNLYRQQGGHFEDVAGPAGAEDMNFGMSASFGDYNRDGWMDIYVSNMFSGAGGRITFQPGFQTEGSDEVIAVYQRMVSGNTLLENAGDGTFRDVSSQARVGVGRWAWGSRFADINNDGWEDVLVANGFVTGNLPGDL